MDKCYSFLKDWKFHLTILLCCMAADAIGPIPIPLFGAVKLTLLPLLYSMVFVTVLYLIKQIKWVSPDQNYAGDMMLGLSCIILMAKLGVSVGSSIKVLWEASLPLIFSNLADSMTCFLALPVALLIGMKRETVGMTFANSREAGIAIIENKYGNKEEFRGVVGMYIVGTVFGTITVGLLTSLFLSTGMFHPYSVAMAAGIGSASMSTAAIGTMVSILPDMEQTVSAFVVASNLISSALAIYVGIFINLPVTEWYYKKLYPVLSPHGRKERRQNKLNKGEEISK